MREGDWMDVTSTAMTKEGAIVTFHVCSLPR
jgi:hypothetical protein